MAVSLVFSQLFYDGHQKLAVDLSDLVSARPACPPSDRLLKVVTLGLKAEEGMYPKELYLVEFTRQGHMYAERAAILLLANTSFI